MKTLEQEVREATDQAVNDARLRLKTESHRIDGELNKHTLATHMAIIQMLNTMVQHRQQIMQLEAAEMQRKQQIAEHEANVRARQKAFEDRQKQGIQTAPDRQAPEGSYLESDHEAYREMAINGVKKPVSQ